MMKLARIIPQQAFLRNKVARQLFLMFVLCALTPIAVMTAISYLRVNEQLSRQAYERLRESSKASGMNLVGRISLLKMDFDLLSADYGSMSEGRVWRKNRQLQALLSSRYRGIQLRSASGQSTSWFGSPIPPFEFSREELNHLSNGNLLVVSRVSHGGSQSVILAQLCAPPDAPPAWIIGEVDPAFFWESDNFVNSFSEILIVNRSMKVLYSSMQEHEPLGELKESLKTAPSGRLEWGSGPDRQIGGYWTIFMEPTFLDTWIIVQSEKRETVLQALSSFRKIFFLVALLMFWVAALLSLTFIRRRTNPIEQLREATQRITSKDFTARVHLNNKDEFGELGNSFNTMAQSLQRYFNTIQTVNKIGKSLSIEEDQTKLLETILKGAKALINADGAILCLVSETHQPTLGLIQIDSLKIANRINLLSEGNNRPEFPEPSTIASQMEMGTFCASDIYSDDTSRFSLQKEFDKRTGYRTQSVLSVPLIDHEGAGIGMLQFINARDRGDGSPAGFSEEDVKLAESLASQAAVAISKNRLMHELTLLFEGLTELIAAAVDAKSPHTADHCKRVPSLTMMIAEAACRVTDGPFKNFKLSADELYELRIAAMLHDCGKVATPVHIMDKSTKLETIHDRIDLIDTRFEIIARDKRIELYRNRLESLLGDAAALQLQAMDEVLGSFVQRMEDDFRFLKECNSGWKVMNAADQTRIWDIAAKYSWIHRNDGRRAFITENEAEHLTVAEGTLTKQERAVVNDHAALTIRMLQALPLPKRLRNLPAYAGAHHERMDGKGYPLGLTGEQISIQGRIISIADIFEALTATDRPYKQARSVSEALAILGKMKEQGQIDPDLFDLFVQKKIYLEYASRFPVFTGDYQ